MAAWAGPSPSRSCSAWLARGRTRSRSAERSRKPIAFGQISFDAERLRFHRPYRFEDLPPAARRHRRRHAVPARGDRRGGACAGRRSAFRPARRACGGRAVSTPGQRPCGIHVPPAEHVRAGAALHGAMAHRRRQRESSRPSRTCRRATFRKREPLPFRSRRRSPAWGRPACRGAASRCWARRWWRSSMGLCFRSRRTRRVRW